MRAMLLWPMAYLLTCVVGFIRKGLLIRRILIGGAVLAATTLMLLWPMAFNRGPVLYPDTFTYVDNGADTI
jgi:hypothetical protein